MKVKEESEKVGLKLNIQKTKIMASGPITSWEIDGETVKTVSAFILGGSKITADGDCTHEIKRHTPWKESYDQPRQHIKKQRYYFANKHPSSQFTSLQSLSHVWLFETPWIAAWQASLSITNSRSSLTQAHRVSDAIQPSHPLSSPSPPAPNPSQHQCLFQWISTSHEVAKVLEFQL